MASIHFTLICQEKKVLIDFCYKIQNGLTKAEFSNIILKRCYTATRNVEHSSTSHWEMQEPNQCNICKNVSLTK